MSITFGGTATGNRYEVGKPYEMNGSMYTAQADGTFRNDGRIVGTTDQGRVITDTRGRGQTLQGSYGNPDVRWEASGDDAARWAAQRNVATASAVSSGGGKVATAQPGATSATDVARFAAASGGMEVPNPAISSAAGFRGAFIRDAAWSGKDDPVQDTMMLGFHWMAAPNTTNAELAEMRYGDVGGAAVGLGVLGIDTGYNARRLVDWMRQPKQQKAAAGAIEDAGQALLQSGFDVWDNVQAASNRQHALDQVSREARERVQDAYDLRDLLEWQEADRHAKTLGEHNYPSYMGLPQDWPSVVTAQGR